MTIFLLSHIRQGFALLAILSILYRITIDILLNIVKLCQYMFHYLESKIRF